MLSALGVGLASGVGLYALAVFSTVFLVVLLGIIESFEKGVKTYDPDVSRPAIRPTNCARRFQPILRRFELPYELRASADAELCYEVGVPLDLERDRVSNAILRLDPQGHASVDWSEKKNKAK